MNNANDFQTGPCVSNSLPGGGSYYCTTKGSANLDPNGTGVALVNLCPPCYGYRSTLADLSEGEQDMTTGYQDMIYGMGAAA